MSTLRYCILIGLLVGCAAKRTAGERKESSGSGLGASGHGYGGGGAMTPQPASSPYRSRNQPSRSDMMQSSAPQMEDAIVSSAPPISGGADKESSPEHPRMVHYNGHVQLEVSRPEETIDEVVARAKEIGGYVERQTRTSVSLRVPVADFQEMYDWALGKGDVLSRSMTARDVTDAHFALDLRLRTARKTRDRLQQLLARAEDENVKIALLKQIQRLTESVDRMERQLKTIAGLADMSRLHVDARSRAVMAGARDAVPILGFGWIGRLSPFSRAVAQSGDKLKLAVPEGLVALQDQDHFQAESADGVIFWTARLDNQPEGGAEFWLRAIQERIGEEFASATPGSKGEFLTLRLVAPSEAPYIYTLALRVDGDELHLVEIYYPSTEAEQRHRAHIEAVLGGGAS